MIVVAIIGLLAAIAIPNFVKARATSQPNACINNLRQIDAAANEWALETRQTTGAAINFPTDLTPYIKLNSASRSRAARRAARIPSHGGQCRDLLVEHDGDRRHTLP